MVTGFVTGVDEWVEQPELDVFNVHGLEVRVVHLAHHAAPLLARVQELAVLVNIG